MTHERRWGQLGCWNPLAMEMVKFTVSNTETSTVKFLIIRMNWHIWHETSLNLRFSVFLISTPSSITWPSLAGQGVSPTLCQSSTMSLCILALGQSTRVPWGKNPQNSVEIARSMIYLGVSIVMGVPHNGCCILENPTKMDDLGVPLFQETSI